MHEKSKLEESKYFFTRMIGTKEEVVGFIHNLSAFLSASRSILQYALKEAEIKQNGSRWYSDNISKSSILRFFRDKRDLNIHEKPVRPQAIHKVMLSETIHLSDSISIVIKDKDGNIKGEYTTPEDPKLIIEDQESSAVSETEYRFSDWVGNEDVMTLCKLYLEELESLIKDGINKGLISG
jgi:hypothetical protein